MTKTASWLSVLFAILLLLPFARAQTGGSPAAGAQAPVYDAVTIRPNKSGSGGTKANLQDDTYRATNVTIRFLLVTAYEIRPGLISGLPGWADSERFDIDAKIVDYDPKANLTQDQRRAMLATMLMDRFHLKVHIETKELPVYELVVAKDGPRLKTSPAPAIDDGAPAQTNNPGSMDVHSSGGIVEMTASAISLSTLAMNLSAPLDRTVIDKTGLTGKYDFDLRWTAENAPQPLPDDAPPLMFTAIQEELGLKLQPGKGPVNTLVVDHVEQPTGN